MKKDIIDFYRLNKMFETLLRKWEKAMINRLNPIGQQNGAD